MEIIEHGKTYQVYTCPRCGCVFVACEIDGCGDDWDGDTWLKCPACGEAIYLKRME